MSEIPNEAEPEADLEDELRPEYDAAVLKSGVRGKHLAHYRSGTNLVLLGAVRSFLWILAGR